MLIPANPVMLADLAHDGKLLWLYCCDCGRERDVDPLSLPLPGETPVPSVGKRMKCSPTSKPALVGCGSRKINARRELYPGWIVAMRERWR
jgi:hypothetical protein